MTYVCTYILDTDSSLIHLVSICSQVKDLEVELETNKQKSKENLQQAILMEREKVTQMQWEMEELRHRSLEMELNLKSKEKKVFNLQNWPYLCHRHYYFALTPFDDTQNALG